MNDSSLRLSPLSETIRLLLLRSGNRCAFPNCVHPLFNDSNILISQCCHIEAAKPGGPRYNQNSTDEQRRAYENLVFFCHAHHKITDDESIYTTEVLKSYKEQHESKFSGGNLFIGDTIIEQVYKDLNGIGNSVAETLELTKQIKLQQDEIFEVLNSNRVITSNDLLDSFVRPFHERISGREKELKNLEENRIRFNTFRIGGVTGIGKTALVSTFTKDVPEKEILWIDCTVLNDQASLLSHVSKYLLKVWGIDDLFKLISSGKFEVIEALKYAAKELDSKSVVVVFDGVSSVDTPILIGIELFNQYFAKSKLFITTSIEINTSSWVNGVHRINLQGLASDSSREILEHNGFALIKDEALVEELNKLLDGHPYLLKLVSYLSLSVPIPELVKEIQAMDLIEIGDYVNKRVLASLEDSEKTLIGVLSILGVPFRYNVYAKKVEDKLVFTSLISKFLIIKKDESFFTVHEFIKRYINRQLTGNERLVFHRESYSYLSSIKTDRRLFEASACIYHALEGNLIEDAIEHSRGLLSNLMGNGDFNLALKMANELASDHRLSNNAFIYYVLGRIHRFQGNWSTALQEYRRGVVCSDNEFTKILKFESASALVNLWDYDESKADLRDEAVSIYQELALEKDLSLSIKSRTALAYLKLKEKEYDSVINTMEACLNELIQANESESLRPGILQILGDAHNLKGNYLLAIKYFDQSIEAYSIAMNQHGMNMIDGLYHAYNSLGWAYSRNQDYKNSATTFGLASSLAKVYQLNSKLESSLFDFGYHLFLSHRYAEACEVLMDYYNLLVTGDLIETIDKPLVFGALTMAHWYNGQFLECIEMLGLHMLYCYEVNVHPIVHVMQEVDMNQSLDINKFFMKRILVLIIPKDKTFEDLYSWIRTIVNERPDLEEVLVSFAQYSRNPE